MFLRFTKAVAILTMLFAMVCFVGCKPDNDNPYGGGGNNGGGNHYEVQVTTENPFDITQTSAVCGGYVYVSGEINLSEIGVCWSKENNPTVDDEKLCTSTFNTPYVCTVTGLTPNTQYHVRAYATSGSQVFYGDDKTFTTKKNSSGTYNGHEYVNLGLPSGTLWATCNVGVNTPEGFGDYFAWAEVWAKAAYRWENYRYCKNGNEYHLTKYCRDKTYGWYDFSDTLTVLEPGDDAATFHWGSGWRIPSKTQWEELLQNTTHTKTQLNGVDGWLFVSTNGNSLFLPSAGSKGYQVGSDPTSGYFSLYWSNLLGDDYSSDAWILLLHKTDGNCMISAINRCLGLPVRPVLSNNKINQD